MPDSITYSFVLSGENSGKPGPLPILIVASSVLPIASTTATSCDSLCGDAAYLPSGDTAMRPAPLPPV